MIQQQLSYPIAYLLPDLWEWIIRLSSSSYFTSAIEINLRIKDWYNAAMQHS